MVSVRVEPQRRSDRTLIRAGLARLNHFHRAAVSRGLRTHAPRRVRAVAFDIPEAGRCAREGGNFHGPLTLSGGIDQGPARAGNRLRRYGPCRRRPRRGCRSGLRRAGHGAAQFPRQRRRLAGMRSVRKVRHVVLEIRRIVAVLDSIPIGLLQLVRVVDMARAQRGAQSGGGTRGGRAARALWEKVEVALNRGFRPRCLRALRVYFAIAS